MPSPTRWFSCVFSGLILALSTVSSAADRPNIIYVMADELGYFEPGFMGGKTIQTPHLDRMAAEGLRFRNLYAGSSLCAPTRCTFLTGRHSGHASVRTNGGGTPLRREEVTIASMLKPLGYATGGFGKWGCGGRDSTGVPEQHGFDVFFGYYDQVHAHSYYAPYLIRNSEEIPLPGNRGLGQGTQYTHYLIHEAAMTFIRDHASQPFFAYLPYTPPHGLFDIPDSDPAWALYKDQAWPEPARRYAAMVTMLDRQVGELLQLIHDLGIEDRTLVFFSGDNGGADYFASAAHPRGIHAANRNPETGVEFRGLKGNLYEGGLRIPFLARWPGRIPAGRVSDHLGYFPDLLPTIAEVTGAQAPAGIDGLSLLPELIGETRAGHPQAQHEYLYWELDGWTAIRQAQWRAVRPGRRADWELYDLATDPSETTNLAAAHPELLGKLEELARLAHEPAREGSFGRTDRHERDRRAKFGTQDEPDSPRAQVVHRTMPTKGLLPSREWKLVRFSSENAANGKLARNAIDGDPGTWWHSRFGADAARPPHELVIDLGAEHLVRGFVCLGRQDDSWNGALKEVEFQVGSSPDGFAAPTARVTLAKSKEPLSVACPEVRGRYVRLRALSEYGSGGFATLSELGVLGD